MMTGPGTNTYLIGDAQTGVAVIDPGPLLEEHIQNILNAAAGPIKWILCTHTHIDHSPAASRIKEKTGAQVYGRPAPAYPNQDQTFAPDHVVAHDEVLKIAGVTLRVIHTPGHASNQVCFLHEEQHMLFTGDHIMQGSTVVINPPDGNMAQYLESLKLITKYAIDYLAPGHGFLMSNTQEIVDRLIIHRLGRENKVLAALRGASQPLPLEELVKHAYADTDQRLHKVAMRSLQAHLDKLASEGRAHHQNGAWSPSH
jgi:glyoxylase-like metal-dependent hydrolase (beta-lactamase superfamily II)